MSSPAATRPLDHYCMTCRYALEHFAEPGQPDRFEHPHAVQHLIGVHEPVAVPMVELLTVNMLCDICLATEPAYAYRFVPVTVRSRRGVEDLGEWWTVCADCAPAVERRDVAGLVTRARIPFDLRRERVPDLMLILGPVYRRLFAAPFERCGARELLRT